ncbi:bestrophin-4-like isoform X2 [Ctenocephalides felis]|uniref:bestrophin-4-like isoform X2 n=1 Tax=Ctenocephalides felis TaxID=7515 RepID=UPI000E6E2642|nr:bestrophin-4-like isoform X2 [Ctenocephalides felis]
MTVTYTAQVATCRGFGCFLKLLLRWRGSIYKLVWLDLLAFLLLYYILNLTYRLYLDAEAKRIFEGIVLYCATYTDLIPLSFVLGFYVSIVMTRWWGQYTSIPWPDPIAVFVSANIHGQDERGRLMRRTILRYVCLCMTMVFSMISPRVKKRFPTLDHLLEAGLLTENERVIMDDLNTKFPRHSKHWLPIVWAASVVTRARKEGRIRDDFAVKTVIDELNKFRGQCGTLISYDTISVPLVYTQVVTLAVYSYFITSIMARQWTEQTIIKEGYLNTIDLYFPFFTTLQFFFYMGWLKVAESLINPFGEDDDDFEVNWLVDRNLQVSYLIVDEMHHDHPELIKDQYWDEVFPAGLPYTVAAQQFREEHPQPSTANIEVSPRGRGTIHVNPSSVKIDDMNGAGSDLNTNANDDAASGIHFVARAASRKDSIRKRERHASGNSQSSLTSMGAVATSITRVNSVTNALKKIFTRDDKSPTTTQTDGGSGSVPNNVPTLMGSTSSVSLHGKAIAGGSMRIADQVIEEVDEQLTITSKGPEYRPSVVGMFSNTIGPPPPSDPVPVPKGSSYIRTQSETAPQNMGYAAGTDGMFSTSAPAQAHIGAGVSLTDFEGITPTEQQDDTTSLRSNKSTKDENFERLKQRREQERQERMMKKFARSISAQQGVAENLMDNEAMLMEIINSSRTSVNAQGRSSRSSLTDKEDAALIP